MYIYISMYIHVLPVAFHVFGNTFEELQLPFQTHTHMILYI